MFNIVFIGVWILWFILVRNIDFVLFVVLVVILVLFKLLVCLVIFCFSVLVVFFRVIFVLYNFNDFCLRSVLVFILVWCFCFNWCLKRFLFMLDYFC